MQVQRTKIVTESARSYNFIRIKTMHFFSFNGVSAVLLCQEYPRTDDWVEHFLEMPFYFKTFSNLNGVRVRSQLLVTTVNVQTKESTATENRVIFFLSLKTIIVAPIF